MKIGVLTHHWVYNFGANLQALATQSTLRTMGFDPVFINYREPSKVTWYEKSICDLQIEKHELFSSKYLRQGPVLRTGDEIEEYCCDSLDVVLVGSDAVFSLVPKYDPLNILRKLRNKNFKVTEKLPPHWLAWEKQVLEKHIFKASLAASSMGTNYFFLTPGLRKKLRQSISDFDYISVRDNWTINMIRSLSGGDKDVELCPDPVFSLNRNFTIPRNEVLDIDVSGTILMAGVFDQGWLSHFVRTAHDRGYQVANCPNPDNEFIYDQFDFTIKLPLSPLAWYNLLSRCAGYVGVRFHALVSCIANQTPVINIDPHGSAGLNRSASKMYDLCQRAGLAKNFFTPQKLFHTDPEELIRLLFSESGKQNSDQYRIKAEKHFRDTLETIVSLAEIKLSTSKNVVT